VQLGVAHRLKQRPAALSVVASVILLGMWLERFVLVVPSLWDEPTIPLGPPEALMTLGFGALFLLALLAFGRAFPWLPTSPAPGNDP
jgi:hypothetical protein